MREKNVLESAVRSIMASKAESFYELTRAVHERRIQFGRALLDLYALGILDERKVASAIEGYNVWLDVYSQGDRKPILYAWTQDKARNLFQGSGSGKSGLADVNFGEAHSALVWMKKLMPQSELSRPYPRDFSDPLTEQPNVYPCRYDIEWRAYGCASRSDKPYPPLIDMTYDGFYKVTENRPCRPVKQKQTHSERYSLVCERPD